MPKGSFVVVTGGSGVGKSTLLDLLAGFQIPNKGSILVDENKDIFKYLNEWRSLLDMHHRIILF